jgi:hypothetical protein
MVADWLSEFGPIVATPHAETVGVRERARMVEEP